MRRMTKPLLGALLALLVFGAVNASASVSEVPCKKKAGSHSLQLCVAGWKLTTGTLPLTYKLKTGASAVITLTNGTDEVSCGNTRALTEAAIGTTGSMTKLRPQFSVCSVKQSGLSERCAVREEFSTAPLKATIGGTAEGETVTLGAEKVGSTEFLELELANFPKGPGCITKGNYIVKGTTKCSLKEAEVEQVVKTLVCNVKSGELTDEGTQRAGFGIEENIELTGTQKGQKFSVIED
jgi:hypothetical protein